jgi:hypothetical protein
MKAKVLFTNGQKVGYYLTNFNATDNGFTGFVENGLFDMRLDKGILYCYYNDGEIANQFHLNSYELVDIEVDEDDDYNDVIYKARVKLYG